MSDLANMNFDTMTPSEFSEHLPELMSSTEGKLSEDPRLSTFLAANPDAAGLVRDLEAIAAAAKSLFDPEDFESDEEEVDANDPLWTKIASKLDARPDPDEA